MKAAMGKGLNMLGAYGDWAASLAASGPGPFSLRNARWAKVEPWKTAARAEVERLLCRPRGAAGGEIAVDDLKVHRVGEHAGVSVEEISWQLPYGPRTEAVLLKPRGATGRLPGILALHDHGGNKYFGRRKITRTSAAQHSMMKDHQAQYYGGVAWANELALQGFVVLVHDTFPFGSRRILGRDVPAYAVERMMGHPEEAREVEPEDLASTNSVLRYEVSPGEPDAEVIAYNAFAAQHETLVAKSLSSAGVTLPGGTLAEDVAALSYLASRPDVDASRLGCGGLSGGGMRTVYLAGTDERIRCAFTAGFMTTWSDFCRNVSYTHTWMAYIPGLPALMDFPEILGLRAPLPSLVLATTEDPLYTLSEVQRAGGILAEVYEKAGAADAFQFTTYAGPHKLDLPMQEEAFAWLRRWLT
jgi:dienelactone hydrolase